MVNLSLNEDMFKEQLKTFEIDVEKMPLGKLSQEQIKKGFQVLEKLKTALDNNEKKSVMAEISSEFYTVIPHSFGRSIPKSIDSAELLKQKVDLLNVLSDIEVAQGMKKSIEKKEESEEVAEEIENPIDLQYDELKNKIQLVDSSSEEFKILEKFYLETKNEDSKTKILDIFTIDREGEKERHDIHKDITHRKLLWHGTNVAVVSAILKTGLRIMPHSGGRVGKGIYFASENAKSAGYVGNPKNLTQKGTSTDSKGRNIGIMFLNEVALGKEHHITRDDSSLKCAPNGYDSIVAKGQQEPDEKYDTTIDGEWGKIIVPQAKPKKTNNKSSFHQSEYLVYKESQVRMKYLIVFEWDRGW
jgi:poly [ADP-ribose] polymerase 2/3/4